MAGRESPKMYSKFPQIEAVLTAGARRLGVIEGEYQKALHAQTIPQDLLVEIKAYLGDLRSALDYLNHKIPASDRYFPICAGQNVSGPGKFDPSNPLRRFEMRK